MEGINNVLQHVREQAPSICLADACNANRKSFGMRSRSDKSSKWSDGNDNAEMILQRAVQHYDSTDEILATLNQFDDPKPIIRPLPRRETMMARLIWQPLNGPECITSFGAVLWGVGDTCLRFEGEPFVYVCARARVRVKVRARAFATAAATGP